MEMEEDGMKGLLNFSLKTTFEFFAGKSLLERIQGESREFKGDQGNSQEFKGDQKRSMEYKNGFERVRN